jgi:protein O-GlcNAc transferase
VTTAALTVDEALRRAAAAHAQGRYGETEAICRDVLAVQPGNAQAFLVLAVAQLADGRSGDGIASLDRAIELDRRLAQAHYQRGFALSQLGRSEEAKACYDTAIALQPAFAEALYLRGMLQRKQGDHVAALADFDAAVRHRPNFLHAYNGRGLALHELMRFDAAVPAFERAIALQPGFADAHNNRGNALRRLKRFDDALASYGRALALRPGYAEALHNRAVSLREMGRYDAALADCEQAIALQPDYAEAHYLHGMLLRAVNRNADARASFARALAARPGYAEAQLAACMSDLPVLFADEAEIAASRTEYEKALRALVDTVEPAAFARAIRSNQPFYLAYQGLNDRELQALYGTLVCRAAAARHGDAPLAPPAQAGEKIRVGIVSGYFYEHSNWKVPIQGWLSQLDRSRFQPFGYYTGSDSDAVTQAAQSLCERFVGGPMSIARWREEILADAPHVLIYPEVGMDPMSAALAAQRLARAQCTSWGHPDTSGFPTLDYYLGSDLMEPPDGETHYTEELVRLPNLSIYYESPSFVPSAMTRRDLGMREGATVFWCGQSTFKFLPQHDRVFARIAREAGNCQFVFIESPGAPQITALFRSRLERAFAAEGLTADDYCLLLRRLDAQGFVAATGLCDVFLDSVGWSGCNTTLESLVHDLPIVTLPGALMRGRHSAAILRMMDVTETIARDIDHYVALAVRLAREAAWRVEIRARIAANKHRIYRDRACIAALENFLERVGRAA